MLSFLFSCSFYSVLAFLAFGFYSKRYAKKPAIDRAAVAISGTNATLASILSSFSLLNMAPEERLDMYGPKTNPLYAWIIESVCGYMLVELGFLFCCGIKLNRRDTSHLISEYLLMEVFHVVGFIGLVSVLFLNTGYPLAMWQIWTELTTVFLVIQDSLHFYSQSFRTFPSVSKAVRSLFSKLTWMVFVSQRVLLCMFLTWLSWKQFPWTLLSGFQFSILVIGTVINTILAVQVSSI